MQIAISTSSFAKFDAKPLKLLKSANITVKQNSLGRVLTEDEAINLFQGCTGIIAGTEPLTAKLMQALPDLKVISRCGTGLNSVDLHAARAHNITVCTTSSPVDAVAELTLGFALGLLRNIPRAHNDICNGIWKKHGGNLLKGKKVGIVGLGNIGQKVAKIFSSLGCIIAYHDPYLSHDTSYTSMDFKYLLAWADIITLHCPPTNTTLINAEELELMQPHALLINTARGGLINEQDLYNHLNSGKLGGAALDVFEVEPYKGPLSKLENVILSPHSASYAKESRIQMEQEATLNLLNALKISHNALC